MNVLNRFKRLYKQIRGRYKSPLPTGMTAFNDWVDDIRATYWLPTEDVDSIRYTLATIIMHLKEAEAFTPKWYFVKVLRAAAAKQVAQGTFQEIKLRQQAAQVAAKLAEATASTAEASNAPKI